jgi:hypothetical protein
METADTDAVTVAITMRGNHRREFPSPASPVMALRGSRRAKTRGDGPTEVKPREEMDSVAYCSRRRVNPRLQATWVLLTGIPAGLCVLCVCVQSLLFLQC